MNSRLLCWVPERKNCSRMVNISRYDFRRFVFLFTLTKKTLTLEVKLSLGTVLHNTPVEIVSINHKLKNVEISPLHNTTVQVVRVNHEHEVVAAEEFSRRFPLNPYSVLKYILTLQSSILRGLNFCYLSLISRAQYWKSLDKYTPHLLDLSEVNKPIGSWLRKRW